MTSRCVFQVRKENDHLGFLGLSLLPTDRLWHYCDISVGRDLKGPSSPNSTQQCWQIKGIRGLCIPHVLGTATEKLSQTRISMPIHPLALLPIAPSSGQTLSMVPANSLSAPQSKSDPLLCACWLDPKIWLQPTLLNNQIKDAQPDISDMILTMQMGARTEGFPSWHYTWGLIPPS